MHDRTALAFAALTSLLWGLTGIFVRLLPPVSPFAIAAGRLLIALAVVLPAFLVSKRLRQEFRAAVLDWMALQLAALLALYYLLATAAFQLAPVAEVALLLATPPLFVLAFRRLTGDTPKPGEIAGALVALAGIGIVLLPRLGGDASHEARDVMGDLLALAAAAATALYAFRYRAAVLAGAAPGIAGVMLLTLLLGGGTFLVPALLYPGSTELIALRADSLPALLGLGILSTAIPTIGFAIASKRLPPTITATVALLIPLFAALFAAHILHQPLTMGLAIGALVVLSGVALIIGSSSGGR